MIIFGTIGFFVRNIPLNSGEMALYRAILAAVLTGLYLLVSGEGFPIGKMRKALPLLLIAGVAMGFNWIFLFQAYRYTSISIATLSYYFAPVIVIVLSPIIFGEKMSRLQWLTSLIATLGLLLLTGVGDAQGQSEHFTGVLYGLAAAALYASVILLNKFVQSVAGIQRTFWQFIGAILILFPYVAWTSGFHFMALDGVAWLNLLIVGLFHTGITYCLYFTALKDLPGQQAAILSYIDPLVAVIVSVAFIQEQLTPIQILGGVLILGASLWNELAPKRKLNETATKL